MPVVSGIGNQSALQRPANSGHADHGANAVVPGTNSGGSFSATLAQAVNQVPAGRTHGDHGGVGGSSAPGPSPSGAHGPTVTTSDSGAHPRHIPIGGSNHGGEHSFQEAALGLRSYRQQLIAANIANADTPGYRAVDIDFQEALRIARSIANVRPLTLATTASGHLPNQSSPSAPPYPLKYHIPVQPSADGNTVEMDVERSKFSENAVMYEFSLDRASGHFKHMLEMFQNLRG